MEPLSILIYALATIGGGTGMAALAMVRAQRHRIHAEGVKASAEAAAIVTDRALALLGPVSNEVTRLQMKLDLANAQLEELAAALDAAQERERTHLANLAELRDELARARARKRGGGKQVM